jgi:hypothetical protein
MLEVEGRHQVATDAGIEGEQRGTGPIGRWVGWCGYGIVVLSLFGAIFPYYANGLGLSLDGAPDGAMTAWRTALHLVPGVLGVIAGVAMVAWSRKLLAGRPFNAAHATFLGRATLVIGGWFAVGPYLYGIIAPSQAHGTGGHAGMVMMGSTASNIMMPTFGHMASMPSTVNCAFTMGVCHWLVGGLIAFGGLVALGAGLGLGPVSGLSKAVGIPTASRD